MSIITLLLLSFNKYTLLYSKVFDPDDDVIRCRWAVASKDECGGICQAFSNAVI